MDDVAMTEVNALKRDELELSTAEAEAREDVGQQSESEDRSDGEPFLAVTRERRSNAGNRMGKLLQLAEAEDADEQFADIFQELANDEEFEEEVDDDADVSMSSSSEDEGEGDQDEEQGEKELERHERQENRKKRKRETLLQQMMKNKAAKMAAQPGGPSIPSASQPEKPRKKSERISWLPEGEEHGPVRASSRKLAVQNKQATHLRLKIKEKQRLKTLAVMRAAEKVKEQNKPKTLTQADRLAEAARIERYNSKTVSKWEEAERQRVAEQDAKLAALKNRRIEGPVITYYSGPALSYYDPEKATYRYTAVGKVRVEKAVMKAAEDLDKPVPTTAENNGISAQDVANPEPSIVESKTDAGIVAYTTGEPPLLDSAKHDGTRDIGPSARKPVAEAGKQSEGFLDGIQAYADMDNQGRIMGTAGNGIGPTSSPAPLITATSAPLISPSGITLIDHIASQASRTSNTTQAQRPTQVVVQIPDNADQSLSTEKISSTATPTASDATSPINSEIPSEALAVPKPRSTNDSPALIESPAPPSDITVAQEPSQTASSSVPDVLSIHSVTQTPTAPIPGRDNSDAPTLPILISTPTLLPQNLQAIQQGPPPPPRPTPKPTRTSLTLISLTNFPNLEKTEPATTAKARQAEKDPVMRALLAAEPSFTGAGKLKPAAPTKCSLTDRPAKYRDPATGLAYADITTLKGIRRVADGAARWSALLGAWVGGRDGKGDMIAAVGVPEGFLKRIETKADASEGPVDGKAEGNGMDKGEGLVASAPIARV